MNTVPNPKAQGIVESATNLLGSTRFQHRYRPVRTTENFLGWTIKDVANGGDDACASFVSYVLRKNGLLTRTRSSVGMMLQDLETHGWERTTECMVGGVALWGFREDVVPDSDREFGHTGLYVGDGDFISHSSYEFKPVKHREELQDGRLPQIFYAHNVLYDGVT